MKLSSVITAALGTAVLTQLASSASAFSLSENFGTGNADGYNISTTVGSFNVTRGNVDLIGNNGSYDFYANNGNYIDLNGNTQGTIESSILNFTGDSATLSFDFGANGSGSANILYGGNIIDSISAVGSSTFSSYSKTFTGLTGGGTLSFASTTGVAGGVVLDNIQFDSIDPVATTVPEPSDLLGTAMAFGSVVLLKRKMTKKNIKL